ncbi:MAG TPA: TolC family protein [Gemmatimonadales bacterium]|nr:TolC family protein [Gemmatimonadales bacterium]
MRAPLLLSFLCAAGPVTAQQPVTRADAVARALAAGARVTLARADSAAAHGLTRAARQIENPVLSASYSKSVPQYHATLDLALDVPWLRSARIGAAAWSERATLYRYAGERAAARLDVEVAYTHALAAAAHARLSARTARDADSLLTMATIRRDAGDASDLDVALATVNAGEQKNAAADDSLAAVAALLDLQALMGQGSDTVTLALADTLAPPAPDSVAPPAGPTLAVAAAEADATAGARAVALERARLLGAPSLEVGVENRDPTGAETGILPVIGLSFPIPLFNWNGGAVAAAAAERDRARAALEVARRESAADIARARRERDAGLAKVARDAELVASAERVAAMSLTAYREGAIALPGVLEAQRNARDALVRYVDDVAALHDAADELRFFSATPETP